MLSGHPSFPARRTQDLMLGPLQHRNPVAPILFMTSRSLSFEYVRLEFFILTLKNWRKVFVFKAGQFKSKSIYEHTNYKV